MKTFVMSYLVCVVPLIYAFFPTFQVAPVDAIVRICFYLAFPLAMGLSLVIVAARHLLGFDHYATMAHSRVHGAADDSAMQSGLKVS